jgi:NAD(P)-dependent dehydrogenase (short-subunit alcohol dehydrogenase family)
MRSYVVTGGAHGVGRAVAERLAAGGPVVVLDVAAPGWTHPRVTAVVGDAGDEAVAERAADAAEAAAPLAGWVNNAAIFRDAALHDTPAADVLGLIAANVGLAVAGCAVAVRRFLARGAGGAIVNVSSHQAQRAVPGALPYATAKAALEGLTRALAVDYGPHGIRVNAVALGSIATGRIEPALEDELRRLHPLGRVGTPAEAAAMVAHLLSDDAAFVNGAVVPVDGGRAALGVDPQARRV